VARTFDIILFGATGFTGGKTAEYLARHAPPELRWAIAGRSQSALDAVKQRLVAIEPRCVQVATVCADIGDDASLERMAAQTQVLLTTVGPFADYGEPVVRACVAQGADYVDSTGEHGFVELIKQRYSQPAAERGVRLVTSCGYDSIPPDLGAYFTVGQLPHDRPIELSSYVSLDAQFSGGTMRSAIKVLANPPKSEEIVVASPRGARVRIAKTKVERKPQFGFVGPLLTVDPDVVTRSAAVLDRYGPDFSFAHYSVIGSLLRAIGAAWVMGVAVVMARFKPTRELLLRILPKPGTGPSDAQIAKSWFKIRFVAQSDGRTLETEVSGGDPGYGETSKMLAESALCLALDRASLPKASGLLTPAVAMGDLLLARLQRAGLRFRVL